MDISMLAQLANSAVDMLVPLLKKVLEKGSEEFGKSSAGALFDKFKQHLSHAPAQAALQDLALQPADADMQAALRVQLRKALTDDPALAAFVTQWLGDSRQEQTMVQTATVTGDGNKTTLITGSGNSVG